VIEVRVPDQHRVGHVDVARDARDLRPRHRARQELAERQAREIRVDEERVALVEEAEPGGAEPGQLEAGRQHAGQRSSGELALSRVVRRRMGSAPRQVNQERGQRQRRSHRRGRMIRQLAAASIGSRSIRSA
jgi:hypothetical protein